MDPLTTSIGLLASVAQLSVYITTFVRGVRDARQDMDAVLRELKSLELCLETLRDDCSDPKVQYPPKVKQMLTGTMSNCDRVTNDMVALLSKVSSRGLSAVSWTVSASGDMNKLRSSLAAHKQAIDIALEMWTLSIAQETKKDTSIIRTRTDDIKMDTSILLQEVSQLRQQVAGLERDGSAGGQYLRRLLDETEDYAESILEQADPPANLEERNSNVGAFTTRDVAYSPTDMAHSSRPPEPPVPKTTKAASPADAVVDWKADIQWVNTGRKIPAFSVKPRAGHRGVATVTDIQKDPEASHNRPSLPRVDSWTNRQLIPDERPLEERCESDFDKEVVPQFQSSSRPAGNIRVSSAQSLPEVSVRTRRLDEVAIVANAKARGRLSDAVRNQLDRELLQKTKEKADIQRISSLLDRGANPDASGPRNTVLTTELQYGKRPPIVELLLQHGADPNLTTNGVPDFEILKDGNMGRMKSLLKIGASVDAVPNRVSVLYLAAVHCNLEMTRLLVDFGANVRPDMENGSMLRPASTTSSSEGSRSPSGDRRGSVTTQTGGHKSALLAAAEAGKWDMVQVLANLGADPNVRGGKYESALQIAAAMDQRDVVKSLLEHGAEVDAQGGYYGSPLIAAAYEGYATIVKILLDNGAHIHTIGFRFGTALKAATLRGHSKIVNHLLDRGADTKIGHVLDVALDCLKDDPEDRARKAIVTALETRGAKLAPADPKRPEYPGLF